MKRQQLQRACLSPQGPSGLEVQKKFTDNPNAFPIFPNSPTASCAGLDSKIIVWDVEGGPSKKIVFERANVGGIAALKFLSPGKFASAGADCSVKIWVI